MPLVMDIIAEHEGVSLSDVRKAGSGSVISYGFTKGETDASMGPRNAMTSAAADNHSPTGCKMGKRRRYAIETESTQRARKSSVSKPLLKGRCPPFFHRSPN